jgi:glycosyltransferase involved in cell wall biosynthesis
VNLLLLTSSFPLEPSDGYAAAGLFVADVARLLADGGHRVHVVTPDKQGVKGAWPGFEVHWLAWPGGRKPLAQINLGDPREWPGLAALVWWAPRRIESICLSERIEGVIAMWAVPAGWWARRLKKRLGLRYVTWCLGSDIWTFGRTPGLRSVVRAALRASDAIYADGLELGRETEVLCGRPCAFLPSSRVLDRRLAAPIETNGRRPLFFFVGRYARVKGVDVLLDAMAAYVRRGGRGELVMRGGGPLEDLVRKRIEREDLRGRVLVGGYADSAVVVSCLASCDVQLIPSRQESIPVAYSDGLQMGRPLIVSDVGDMGDLMRRHEAGLVVPVEDADALAEAMLSIDRDGTDRYRQAVIAASREFDLEKSARTLVTPLTR